MRTSLALLILLAAESSAFAETGYYPNQGWGPDDHVFSVAYRDNGFDGGAFQPASGDTITVCTRFSIRAKESGAGSSTIDVVLYRWSGSDWDEYSKATVTVDGGTYAWCHSSALDDTLSAGYYRLGCCNVIGNPVTVQCTIDLLAEGDAYVKPSTSSCPDPWGVWDEDISFHDLDIYMTYTEECVEKAADGRRRKVTDGERRVL